MAGYTSCEWAPSEVTGLPRREHLSGPYSAYVPDLLADRPLAVSPAVSAKAAGAERAVQRLVSGSTVSLEGVARFLLRSEAIASSLIEGIAPSPQQVALAELAQDEPIRGFGDQARLVANNITILKRATAQLVESAQVNVVDIEQLQSALLIEERHHGLRVVQNWIGGSSWHPMEAAFVPPPADQVPGLMDDLIAYLNGSAHAPLIQAALVHAQFETIHPFTDGNGRVGRALIHCVLARRRLTPTAMLPISLVLATLRDTYIDGLTAYRYVGAAAEPESVGGVGAWLNIYLDATLAAVEQAARLSAEVDALRADWAARLARLRSGRGKRIAPRTDSATARILALLTEVPVMTTRTVERVLGVSSPQARAALEELADSAILDRKAVERGTTGYVAREVLDLIAFAERRLGSTRFDTRASPPNRTVPAAPSSS